WAPALLAGLLPQHPPTLVDPRVTPRLVLLALFLVQRMGLAPSPHVHCVPSQSARFAYLIRRDLRISARMFHVGQYLFLFHFQVVGQSKQLPVLPAQLPRPQPCAPDRQEPPRVPVSERRRQSRSAGRAQPAMPHPACRSAREAAELVAPLQVVVAVRLG